MEYPFQKMFSSPPNYSKLRVYGCLCFPWLPSYTKHKLGNRSAVCVLLGYSLTHSAYLCLQPTTCRIYVSRYVQLDEKTFPFSQLHQRSKGLESLPQSVPNPPVSLLPTPQPLVTLSLLSPDGPTSSGPHQTVSSAPTSMNSTPYFIGNRQHEPVSIANPEPNSTRPTTSTDPLNNVAQTRNPVIQAQVHSPPLLIPSKAQAQSTITNPQPITHQSNSDPPTQPETALDIQNQNPNSSRLPNLELISLLLTSAECKLVEKKNS